MKIFQRKGDHKRVINPYGFYISRAYSEDSLEELIGSTEIKKVSDHAEIRINSLFREATYSILYDRGHRTWVIE